MAFRAVLSLLLLSACTARSVSGDATKDPAPPLLASSSASPLPAAEVPPPKPETKPSPSFSHYPWLADEGAPKPVASLEERFPTEKGFTRVELAPESFGAFLRGLPLIDPGAPVLSYRGDIIRAPNHPHIAAVVALDVGNADLQQCADAVIRMHAEWRYSRGHRDHAYRAASGTTLSFPGYLAGDRVKVNGNKISLVRSARASGPSHDVFRLWLDQVFEWANTAALARDGERVKLENLRPGDFFVLTGVPFGHAVLVLDIAKDAQGRRALLLGQSFVPAQSYQVLRPSPETAWFVLDEAAGALTTPFWEPFPFDSLRRLPD